MILAAQAVPLIPLSRLSIALIPVGVVLLILGTWAISVRTPIYAIFRMLLQLMLIGYVLQFIFDANSPLLVTIALTVMLIMASWISLRVTAGSRLRLMPRALTAITVGGGATLVVITQGVLQLDPWYLPQKLIPLAGMIFAGSMNSVSLALERFEAELLRGESYGTARITAFEASLIPITNSLFAVGLVSIPGMMTGQLLMNAPPATAARYQIMVMCMMFASAGLSSSLYLTLARRGPASGESQEDPPKTST